MPSLFISRSLAADSPIRQWTEDKAVDLFAQSLLTFKAVAFDWPPTEAYDWIFFYSPRAVRYFLEARPLLPNGLRLGAVGKGTAAALEALGHRVDFCGAGSPEQVASDFLAVGRGQRILFPCAINSRRSIASLLAGQITALHLVVYENDLAIPSGLPTTDIVILTSPMNAEAYFTACSPSSEATYLAIGRPTAEAMAAYGVSASYPPIAEEAALCGLLDDWARRQAI